MLRGRAKAAVGPTPASTAVATVSGLEMGHVKRKHGDGRGRRRLQPAPNQWLKYRSVCLNLVDSGRNPPETAFNY